MHIFNNFYPESLPSNCAYVRLWLSKCLTCLFFALLQCLPTYWLSLPLHIQIADSLRLTPLGIMETEPFTSQREVHLSYSPNVLRTFVGCECFSLQLLP